MIKKQDKFKTLHQYIVYILLLHSAKLHVAFDVGSF